MTDAEITLDQQAEEIYAAAADNLDALEKLMLSQIAIQKDDPEGFAAFYKLIHGNDLPAHLRKEIEHIYDAKEKNKGSLIFAWRGSWKTTTISVTFVAWRIGKEPHRANLVVQANDQKAAQTTKQIADIIENHPHWKLVFPTVEPDPGRAWGENGYEVKDISMDYPSWRAENSARKDPTLVGYGIGSKSLIGTHIDGVLLLDDIHDEENTVSPKERQAVVNKVTGTIMPFITEDPDGMYTWFIAVGTPWTEDDAYHYLQGTGELEFLDLPVMTQVEPNTKDASEINSSNMTVANHTDIYGWWVLTWPEMFGVRQIVTWRNRTGKREFARMYLLDLAAAKETGIKYFLYPNEQISLKWRAGSGVDYASIIQLRNRRLDDRYRSKYALAYGLELPIGGAVIYDGVFGNFTQAEGESYVERAQNMFPFYNNCGVEMDGKGEEFFALLQRKPYIKLLPFWTKGKSKPQRHDAILSPLFEVGLLRVSDADTPFLNELRKSLDDYPYGNLDVLDAVYAYTKTVPGILVIKDTDHTPKPGSVKPKQKNPYFALGRR